MKRKFSIPGFIVLFVFALVIWVTNKRDDNKLIDGRGNPVEETKDSVRSSHYVEQLEMARTPDCLREQVIVHQGYTVSWNPDRNIPNYVAYELTDNETTGDEGRANHFVPDPETDSCPTTDDYKGFNYDRGHMAPAADMKWSEQAMKESFYMTNICPQNSNLNREDWRRLEEHVRTLAVENESVCIAVGPIVKSRKPKTIGQKHKIVVPDAFFKVLLLYRDNSWHAIGFMMNNEARKGAYELKEYACSVDEVEAATGLDFFYNLPDTTENRIEALCPAEIFGL